MKCIRCRKSFEATESKCPYCGQPRPDAGTGVFQTSTVLISSEGAEHVYRSVEEIPDALRTKLLKSTNSSNSATILIADRRGRQEISKALRNLPGARRMPGSPVAPVWLTPRRKAGIIGVILSFVLALVVVLFTHRW